MLLTVKGVLVTPFLLKTSDGLEIKIQEEKFYNLNREYYFQLDNSYNPVKIVYAIYV